MPFLFAALVLAGAGWFLHGQEPEKEIKAGKVLLLRTGHVMEGDIQKVGAQMRIRNGTSEIWISAERSIRLFVDWDDAYVFLQSLVKLDDADGRVKLARWCHMNRLNAKALEQAKYALELQPGHPEAQQIVATLERSANEPEPLPASVTAANPAGPIRPKETAPTVDVTSETSIAFAAKVQPILMNTCANCHCTSRGGKLDLERVSSPMQKAATLRNLAKVLMYIDLDRPAISPLLLRAIQAHGTAAQPAIPNRDAKAFQTLHQWIELAVARNPHLKDYAAVQQGAPAKKAAPMPAGGFKAGFTGGEIVSDLPPIESALTVPETKKTAAPGPAPAAKDRIVPHVVPQVAPIPADPHDPSEFNDFYHPKR